MKLIKNKRDVTFIVIMGRWGGGVLWPFFSFFLYSRDSRKHTRAAIRELCTVSKGMVV